MRKLLLAAFLAALPIIAFPSKASAQTGYIEGSVGFLVTNSVETDEFSALTSAGLFEGTIDFDYDAQWAAGLEGGFQTGPWRFGVAWDYISSEVESRARRRISRWAACRFLGNGVRSWKTSSAYRATAISTSLRPTATINSTRLTWADRCRPFSPISELEWVPQYFQQCQYDIRVHSHSGRELYARAERLFGRTLPVGPSLGPGKQMSGVSFGEITTHTFSLVLGYRFPV